MEKTYEEEIKRLNSKAQRLIEKWLASNPDLINDATSAATLISQIRGIFRDVKNLRRIFGQVSSLIDQDVLGIMNQTIPTVPRSALVPVKATTQFARTNAGLIKTLGGKQADDLAKIIRGSSGRHVSSLTREMQERFAISQRRAKFWARDQTLKLHGQITQERHIAAGIKGYYWTDSNDAIVRERHGELGAASDSGKVYLYADPPRVSADGETPERRENPGGDFNCRCTGRPAI